MDQDVRSSAREAAAADDIELRARLLLNQMRAGERREQLVVLAADLGSETALVGLGWARCHCQLPLEHHPAHADERYLRQMLGSLPGIGWDVAVAAAIAMAAVGESAWADAELRDRVARRDHYEGDYDNWMEWRSTEITRTLPLLTEWLHAHGQEAHRRPTGSPLTEKEVELGRRLMDLRRTFVGGDLFLVFYPHTTDEGRGAALLNLLTSTEKVLGDERGKIEPALRSALIDYALR